MNEKTYERVIEYLKQQIQEGKLSCGSKIPSERELAASLNLGRNSVREALRTMEHTGMLESRQGKGNFQCTGTLQVQERGFALRQYLQQCWYGEIQIQQDESRLRGDIFSQSAEGLSGAVQSVRTDQSESDGIHNE